MRFDTTTIFQIFFLETIFSLLSFARKFEANAIGGMNTVINS